MKIPDKLAVAKGHLESAALLMAMDGDERAAHVLIHAAEELVRTYAKATGKKLAFDFYGMIRPEKRGDVKFLMRKAYNYFKHADNDAEEPYAGPTPEQLYVVNAMLFATTVENLRGLGVAPGRFVEVNSLLCAMEHPEAFNIKALPEDQQAHLRTMVALKTPESVASLRLTAWLADEPDLARRLNDAVNDAEQFDWSVPKSGLGR